MNAQLLCNHLEIALKQNLKYSQLTLYAEERKQTGKYSKKVSVQSHIVLTTPDNITQSEQSLQVAITFHKNHSKQQPSQPYNFQLQILKDLQRGNYTLQILVLWKVVFSKCTFVNSGKMCCGCEVSWFTDQFSLRCLLSAWRASVTIRIKCSILRGAGINE